MADFDFLDGFDTSGDWGFTGVAEKPSDKAVSDSKQTEQVVKQTADGVGKAVWHGEDAAVSLQEQGPSSNAD